MRRTHVPAFFALIVAIALAFLAVQFDAGVAEPAAGPVANINDLQIVNAAPGQDLCRPNDAAFVVEAVLPPGEVYFLFLYTPNPGSGEKTRVAFILVDPAREQVWFGKVTPDGAIHYLGQMPLAEFKEKHPEPCGLLFEVIPARTVAL